ncbi:MAG: PEP-CTERM sorting domain-containing protein [Gammaproteobacteria bacterium]
MMAGIMLLGLASTANAIPTLTFGGHVSYTASTGLLSLDGQLLGSQSIIKMPDCASSWLSLSTTLISPSSANGVTVGAFGPGSINIGDSSGSLLTGGFSLAQMGGLDGSDQGALSLLLTPTGGSLLSYFSDPSDLFAMTLNLSTPFGADIFSGDFTGDVNGNVTSRASVPEPGIISLLIVGLGLFGISGWYRRETCVRID